MSVLETNPYIQIIGQDVEALIHEKLTDAGSETRGPDRSGEFTSNCPAHADTKASLRWRVGIDGRALIMCHSGCEYTEILDSLGIKSWQLNPTQIRYDYYDAGSEYQFTVVREFGADGGKGFWQGTRSEDGRRIEPGKGEIRDTLWRMPDLAAWAAKTVGGTLYITEGEHDTAVLQWALEAEDREGEQATTAPGGARKWSVDLTVDVVRIAGSGTCSRVVILCDRDPAGIRRGQALVGELQGALGGDVAVLVMVPRDGVGKDIAEVVDRHGVRGWEGRIEPVDETMALEGVDGSLMSGGLTRTVEPMSGRTVLAAAPGGRRKEAEPIMTGDLEVTAWWSADPDSDVPSGWEVEVRPLVGRRRRVVLTARDLSDPPKLRRWLIETAGLGRGTAEVGYLGDALIQWLRWQSELVRAPQVVASDVVGWIDVDTGKPASVATERMLWVDETGTAVTSVGIDEGDVKVRFTGNKAAHCRWGVAGDEQAARWALARVLTFADPEVVAVTVGWAAATVLGPWLAEAGIPIRPGLAVVAPSGSGKTNGAAAWILALAGCTGPLTTSRAAYRRLLQSGVGTIRWLDDSDLVEDPGMKELLRVATTRSDHVLANADGGATATEGAELTGSPVISAEGVRWLEETAMTDRFALVQPPNPQGRISLVPGRHNKPQWDDITELLRQWPDLTVLAGWMVKGLTAAAVRKGSGDPVEGLRKWIDEAGGAKGRRGSVQAAIVAGVAAVSEWLEEGAAQDDWEGAEWGGIYASWGWLRDAALEWKSSLLNETSAIACSLTDIVLPRLLREDAMSVTVKGRTPMVVGPVDAGSYDSVRTAVMDRITIGDVTVGLPAVIIDLEGRYWVNSGIAALHYQRAVGRYGAADSRLVSDQAISDQVKRLAEEPEWASWSTGKAVGGAPKKRYGLRLGGRDARVVYRRLDEVACMRVRAVMEEGV